MMMIDVFYETLLASFSPHEEAMFHVGQDCKTIAGIFLEKGYAAVRWMKRCRSWLPHRTYVGQDCKTIAGIFLERLCCCSLNETMHRSWLLAIQYCLSFRLPATLLSAIAHRLSPSPITSPSNPNAT
jgi:hypothetical protein